MRRLRHLLRLHNTLDFSLLEPGDLVLVANPTDPWLLRATVFWSHVAIYVGESEDHAFVDAVNLPIRRAGRRPGHGLPWQRVRFTSLRMFRTYVDVLVLRPDLPVQARRAAADYARAQVGKPFCRGSVSGFIRGRAGRRPGRSRGGPSGGPPGGPPGMSSGEPPQEFTCSSLVWHAYLTQGFDLSSGPLRRLLVPWPSLLGHDRRLAHVGRGTRLRPIGPAWGRLSLWLVRAWFRWVLRSDISWRGEPDVPPSGGGGSGEGLGGGSGESSGTGPGPGQGPR